MGNALLPARDRIDMDISGLVGDLLAEASHVDERRLLVLSGDREAGYETLRTALESTEIPPAGTTLVGPEDRLRCEHLPQVHAGKLLGTTRDAVVLDAHEEFRPNALGRVVGAVDGGGLLVLLTPPLEAWPDRRDQGDRRLAVPPYDVEDVTGRFRRRLVETLRIHLGIAVVDVDAEVVERDGLTEATPRQTCELMRVPEKPEFPEAAYEACLTADQVEAVQALEALTEPAQAVVVEADRGRGKSAAAGLAAASLAADGRDVLVTAPEYRGCEEVFVRARALFSELGALGEVSDPERPRRIEAVGGGKIRYAPPTEAAQLPEDPNVVLVDEAAALPVRLLESFLGADRVAFTTTIHGYEGAGRGFSVRFRDRLEEGSHDVTEVGMAEPIRYAPGDPVEVWAFRALLLNASPAVEELVSGATPETADYRRLSADELADDEHLLREVFGLLVLAHYRTEPDDLARLLDAPNLSVVALFFEGHVVAVALLAREGNLPRKLREKMYAGARVAGNMLPDVLTSQLRDEDAGAPAGVRVMRIATHPAVRSRGLGSWLLSEIRNSEECADLDWLGVGFGATPELLSFWRDNGYGTVHLSTTRNESSGEYSALMLDSLSEAGRELHDRHARWFVDRVCEQLSDTLDDADPDVVRAVLRACEVDLPVDLSAREWLVVADTAYGPGVYISAPGGFRKLAVKQLVDPADPDLLSARQERLLVLKVLQGRTWEVAREALGYHSHREVMRALGEASRPLVETYGDEKSRAQKERFEG